MGKLLSPRRLALPLLAAALTAAALASCEKLTGINDLQILHTPDAAPVADGGAEADAPVCVSTSEDDCSRCLEQSCCAEGLACSSDEACKACLSAPTPSCDGLATLVAYRACAADKGCPCK